MWVRGLTSREAITPAHYSAESAHQIEEKVEYKVFERDQFGPAAQFASLGIEAMIVKPEKLCQPSGPPIRLPRRPLGANPTGKARAARHCAGT